MTEEQQKVFSLFTSTSKNIVLSAPTGWGKTKLAIHIMLTMKERVLYASPLKSLSTQVFNDVKKYTDDVAYVSGDEWWIEPEMVNDRIVITTYEKADSMLRHSPDWGKTFALFVIDEVHNISQRTAIEFLSLFALFNKIRIIAFSATLPNVKEIAEWLGADYVSFSKRPVGLYIYAKYKTQVFGPPEFEDIVKNDIIEYSIENKKPVLIFTQSRKMCYIEANKIRKEYGIPGELIGIFHAGLSKAERDKLLKEIEEKKKLVVISTTALGQGVNLPIFAIIFKSIKLPLISRTGKLVGWRKLTKNEFDQIAGRAGRPGFDKYGIVVVEAKDLSEYTQMIKKFIKGKNEDIEGTTELPDLLLYLISINDTISKEDLNNLVTRSYTYKTTTTIEQTLQKLKEVQLITEIDNKYKITPLGRQIVLTYLNVDDALFYLPKIKSIKNKLHEIEIIANSPKITQNSRGIDIIPYLLRWMKGDELELPANFSWNDFQNILQIAEWQAYAIEKLANVLNLDSRIRKEFHEVYLQIKYGVPTEYIEIAKLLGRKCTKLFIGTSLTKKEKICTSLLGREIIKKNNCKDICS